MECPMKDRIEKLEARCGVAASPCKFEVGQRVKYCRAAAHDDVLFCGVGKITEIQPCGVLPAYRINGMWFAENEIVAAVPFKAGDWVRRVTTGIAGRITSMSEHIVVLYATTTGQLIIHLRESDLEPWTPRNGEIVMQRTCDDKFTQPFVYDSYAHESVARLIPAPFGPDSKDWFA